MIGKRRGGLTFIVEYIKYIVAGEEALLILYDTHKNLPFCEIRFSFDPFSRAVNAVFKISFF